MTGGVDKQPTADETWNTCPDCGMKWKDEKPTPGLLHRTRLCKRCAELSWVKEHECSWK